MTCCCGKEISPNGIFPLNTVSLDQLNTGVLSVIGNANFAGITTITNLTATNMTITDLNTLNVTATNEITAGFRVNTRYLTTTDNTVIGGTLEVAHLTTLTNGLNVNGQTNLQNSRVSGIQYLDGPVTATNEPPYFWKGIVTEEYNGNNSVFKYKTGSWTPNLGYIHTYNGTLNPPGGTPNYIKRDGYYSRMGNSVTVYFDLVMQNSVGGDVYANGDLTGYKIPVITSLPYRIGSSTTPIDLKSLGLVEIEYPNGYVGPIPGIGVPVIENPMKLVAYEYGTEVPLLGVISIPVLPPGSPSWTTDGYVLFIDVTASIYIVNIAPPAILKAGSVATNLNNSWNTGADFIFKFRGNITYITDQPF